MEKGLHCPRIYFFAVCFKTKSSPCLLSPDSLPIALLHQHCDELSLHSPSIPSCFSSMPPSRYYGLSYSLFSR
ncbi:hypothetical protein ES332_A05G424600v1 [Gossypium tomentosum]|uniref:Uncharacterized protein n=1 Tax=Gossypium tomentosum TaxID=34277 RepID=A0A5D2QS90_GOSTO|nr:hypothetical protein ES332_A05G424600v1 [Gossypium tomentosum]